MMEVIVVEAFSFLPVCTASADPLMRTQPESAPNETQVAAPRRLFENICGNNAVLEGRDWLWGDGMTQKI